MNTKNQTNLLVIGKYERKDKKETFRGCMLTRTSYCTHIYYTYFNTYLNFTLLWRNLGPESRLSSNDQSVASVLRQGKGARWTATRLEQTDSTMIETKQQGLTGGNWQKWKRVFLTCPCHEIYRDEAVGLKSCKNTWKITIFVKMWNLGQYRENLIFCQ